jgi:hypothetical protein
MNCASARFGYNRSQKGFEMRDSPGYIRLIGRVPPPPPKRRPTVQNRRSVKLQVIGELSGATCGILKCIVLSMNKDEGFFAFGSTDPFLQLSKEILFPFCLHADQCHVLVRVLPKFEPVD